MECWEKGGKERKGVVLAKRNTQIFKDIQFIR